MKAFLALILCGISCAVASPTCDDYAKECIKTQGWGQSGNFHPETVSDLEKFCKDVLEEFDCQVDFTERCPNTLLGAFRDSLKEYRRVFGRFCDKTDPISQKYLEKAPCLNEKTQDAEQTCQESATEQEFCKRTTEVLKCTEEEINNTCGQDGEEVVSELYKPKFVANNVFCGL